MADTPENPVPTPSPGPKAPNPIVKLAIEVGPLVLFFVTNAKFGIYAATGTFMVAITVALLASWLLERRLPPMALFTAVFVLVLGGLTIYLENDLFIKLKPTIVNTLFALILIGGLMTGRLLLKVVFSTAFTLTDEGWRLLTHRWIVFFFVLAIVNEIVWRNVSTDTWVTFKVFGIMPLTVVFTLTLIPFLMRHAPPDPEAKAASEEAEG